MSENSEMYWFLKDVPEKNKDKSQFVYFIRFDKWLKVGTTNDLYIRFNSFRFALPENIGLMGYFYQKNTDLLNLEKGIQNDLIGQNTIGEWFIYDEELVVEVINHWADMLNIKFIRHGTKTEKQHKLLSS